MKAIPHSLFHGLFLAAALLGLFEACHVALTADDAVALYDRGLSALYAMSPFIIAGLAVAVTTSSLVLIWTRTRQVTTIDQNATPRHVDLAAALLTTLAFVVTLFVVSRFLLELSSDRSHAGAGLAILTPLGMVASLYLWAILRSRLLRLDEVLYPHSSTVLAAIFGLAALAVPATAVFKNEALVDFLGGWAILYLLLYPVLVLGITSAISRLPESSISAPGTRRAVVLFAVFCAAGTVDLVYRLENHPAVKRTLLNHSLVMAQVLMVAQPLFDFDGDGYSSLLGGGDCDDSNPQVYPGALEIPRNAIDDDCFMGDSPGQNEPVLILQESPKKATQRGLVERPNIVLITVDTLRADHLGYMGYERNTSPHLDQLAESGLRFSWAFAQGPQTKASVPSMFTGRYFSEVDRSPDIWPRIYRSNLMLAERLKTLGYATAGIPAHRFFIPNYGLDQGFDHWDLTIVERFHTRTPYVVTGHLSSKLAIKWLNARTDDAQPFFLWIHYFDPHFKYRKHKNFDFGDTALDRYDSEIAYTDQQIEKVTQWIRNSPVAESTYFIITADHGEGFGLHGYKLHGQHLFNDQVRVPLIINGPGLRPRLVQSPVALIDIVPTVLDLAGGSPDDSLTGVSLLPFGTETKAPKRGPVFVEMLKDATHSDRRVIVDWPWKLQYGITFDEYSLYNLANDPDELRSLVGTNPMEFTRLQRRLRRWMSSEVKPLQPR